jgi:hypothetical protein
MNTLPTASVGSHANIVGILDECSMTDALVNEFTTILTGRRTNAETKCFLESIMDKANPHKDLSVTAPDVVLMDLFNFDARYMPRVDNLICAELGRLTEKLVAALFKAARQGQVLDAAADMLKLQARYEQDPVVVSKRGHDARAIKWKKPDFQYGRDAILEVKYRFNSYQSKQQQIEAAYCYAHLGFSPIFLHISPDCQQYEDFLAAGWKVYVGTDALQYIKDETGIDFQAILKKVSAQPIVQQRLLECHQQMIDVWEAESIRDIEHAHPQVRSGVLTHIAHHPDMMKEVIIKSPFTPEELAKIRRGACDIATETMGDLQDKDIDELKKLTGILDKLDEEQKTEACRMLMKTLSEDALLGLQSEFG